MRIAQFTMYIVRWAFHFWWMWCLIMLALVVVSIGIGKVFGKSGTRDDEGR